MFSQTVVPAPPVVLLLDASRNVVGWEAGFCDRLFEAMARRGLAMMGGGALRVDEPSKLEPSLAALERASCLLLVSRGDGSTSSSTEIRGYIAWLKTNVAGPKFLAVCSWQDYNPALTAEILALPEEFAPLALAQQSPITAREAGLFFLKFFTELALHSEKEMTGRMAWFSCSKAKELLKRRRLEGTFGLRT